MAIIKSIENQYGADFNYHKLREVKIRVDENKGVILIMKVESYLDKDARQQGKTPVVTLNTIVGADFALTPFYKILERKFPQFKDCSDDFDNSHKPELIKKSPVFGIESQDQTVNEQWREEPAEEVTQENQEDK